MPSARMKERNMNIPQDSIFRLVTDTGKHSDSMDEEWCVFTSHNKQQMGDTV